MSLHGKYMARSNPLLLSSQKPPVGKPRPYLWFFLSVRTKVWPRNDLTRPFRRLSPPNSPPNSPGFHHFLCLYGNKEQRRRQRFLFSILLMVRWLLTKSNFKIKHTSNGVISKINKGFVERDPKSRSEVCAGFLDLSRQITRRR